MLEIILNLKKWFVQLHYGARQLLLAPMSELISVIEIQAQIHFLLFREQHGATSSHPQWIDRSKANRFSILQCVAHFPWRSRGDKDTVALIHVRYVIPAVRLSDIHTKRTHIYGVSHSNEKILLRLSLPIHKYAKKKKMNYRYRFLQEFSSRCKKGIITCRDEWPLWRKRCRSERYVKHPVCTMIGPPACDHQWFRLGPTMPRISSFPDFVLLFLRGSARRCAPKLRRQKTSVRFDSIEGTRPGFFVPFGALPSYNDCIMTIAVSIFICGSARSRAARAAPPRPQHARASLLISCLPIFLLFIFARSSSTPCRISRIVG